MPITRTFTFQEFCQVLAALRHWQFHQEGKSLETVRMDWDEHFEDCEPMTMQAIDALCERINFEDKSATNPEDSQKDAALDLAQQIARFSKDGEMVDPEDGGEPYEFQLQDGDDAATTLHGLIDQARAILGGHDPA
jgi:hypothetical protein